MTGGVACARIRQRAAAGTGSALVRGGQKHAERVARGFGAPLACSVLRWLLFDLLPAGRRPKESAPV